jgi:hypothetical protein
LLKMNFFKRLMLLETLVLKHLGNFEELCIAIYNMGLAMQEHDAEIEDLRVILDSIHAKMQQGSVDTSLPRQKSSSTKPS